jgi:hypothetical protein
MSAEQVTVISQCEECWEVWLLGDAERGKAYWIDDGPDERLLLYCSVCARREFGD